MAKTNLKRMNRFELLELMYKLVVENENLSQRCAELERQLNYGSRGGDYRSARESPRDYYDEPRTMTRREEILARMDEQSSRPASRREAPERQGTEAPRRRSTQASRATAPAESSPVRAEARRPAPQPQQKSSASRPAAQPKASAPASPTTQAQPVPRAPVKPARMPPEDDFDIDSILEDYFSDLPFDSKGRDA